MDVSHHNGKVAEISEKLEKSLSMDTDDKMETYHRYPVFGMDKSLSQCVSGFKLDRFIQDGKDAARNGDMHKALEFFKLAYNIHQSQKLESRIKKIEELLAQNDSEEEDDEFVSVNNSGLMLFKELHDKLYDYQRNGVAFLYSLYKDGRKGGILADDMGLGKTIQVISFLSGMYDNELIKHTLLVMPTSLITNWTKEFAKWTPGMRVKEFHGASKGERTRNLEKVQRRSGVIITTYTMLLNNWQQLSSYHGREFTWDYMILDEAHKIKGTSTKTAKSASAIPSKNRVLLTGTPVQNNLREMWALFDFACQGTLLGTAKTFKSEYENPITRAREKDATPGERALGSRMSENLMAIIKPYFLRRTKSEVQKNKLNSARLVKEKHSDNKESNIQNHEKDSGATMPTLTRKNDLIVWTYLSAVQEDIYRQFISLDHIKELLMTTKSPLAELNILKKLCDHPRLLSAGAIAKLGLEESTAESQHSDDVDADSHSIANISDDTLISESGKLVFLFSLLERLKLEGHRTLVFAHYRKVLDIIERILGNRGFKVLRLDGTITQIAERERLISLFQKDQRYSVFLLTTQVGGVGITLTAANRVVIYDPSWNPATDAQAVDRAYRIGQTENVVIYRLITCGTVEEKIYRRQVFKDSLIRQNTGDKKNPFRYFSKQELKELFTLEETRSSSTQLQLQALHSRHRRTDPELDEHIAHLHAMEMFGISDHDLMFSLDVNHDEAPENQEEHRYIEGRVQKAQELMKAESELQMQLAGSMSSSTEPAWLRQPSDSNSRERSQEKKPRNARPSPSYPQNDSNFNGSPVVVELDQSGSGKEDSQQNQSVIDLTVDESMREDQPDVDMSHNKLENPKLDSPNHRSVKQERSFSEAADTSAQEMIEESEDENMSIQKQTDQSVTSEAANVSVQELVDRSVTSEAANVSVQELVDRSVMSEAANVSVQELVDRSVTSEAANVSVQELVDRSLTSEAANVSVQELVDRSVMSEAADPPAGEASLPYVTAVDEYEQQLNRTLHSQHEDSKMDLSHPYITPLQNKRVSILQASSSSFKADTSRVSAGVESFEGNFNLQLEDSDMFSDHDVQDQQEAEVEERKLLSQLQIDGSFDVNKSLCEVQHKEALGKSLSNGCDMDDSMNDSVIVRRKKRAAVIYDSEEDGDDDDDERQQLMRSQLENSFQVLGASTPKSAPSRSTPGRSRKSIGGNASVASRRSLLHSIIEDMENNNQDMVDEDESSDDGDISERHSDEAEEEEEEDIDHDNGLQLEETNGETINTDQEEEEEEDTGHDELQLEETNGETINTDEEEEDDIGHDNELQLEETNGETINTEGEEEEEEEQYSDESGEEMSSNLESSTEEPELESTERMDQCTVDAGVTTSITVESESYDSLVSRGRQCYSQGKLDDALGFFLRAIDIQPGDPEIQLMTIQMYRQLSQRK